MFFLPASPEVTDIKKWCVDVLWGLFYRDPRRVPVRLGLKSNETAGHGDSVPVIGSQKEFHRSPRIASFV